MQKLNYREAVVFSAVECAAINGRPCPSNDYLCVMLGSTSSSTAVRLIKVLECKGLIEVARFNHSRVVRIVATGKETVAVYKSRRPHWSEKRHA